MHYRGHLWHSMVDHVIGSLIDPHSGDVLRFIHIEGTGPSARLDHLLIAASLGRIDSTQPWILGNMFYASLFFNVMIHAISFPDAYRHMASWLGAAGDLPWWPVEWRRFAPSTGRMQHELLQYARRCYARHRVCAATCMWCGGFFADGDADRYPDQFGPP
jgi:hypothetical protein